MLLRILASLIDRSNPIQYIKFRQEPQLEAIGKSLAMANLSSVYEKYLMVITQRC